MDIQAISGAATVAIASSIVFLIAAKSWQLLSGSMSGTPNFAESIMTEAAQRFRDELRELSRAQSTWLGAALVFVVIYATAFLFQSPQLFIGYPEWQLWLLLTTLAGAGAFALYRLTRTVLAWRHVRFLRDANVAVGHQLQRIAAEHGRVYHDVRTSAGIVDHVLIGQAGIYTINVFALRHSRKGSVKLGDDELRFSGTDTVINTTNRVATSGQLEKEFSQLTGKNIRVRSVIAVPGWDIDDQGTDNHLLVNERTLPMMTGWKDQGDHLMNEDVNVILDDLTRRCRLKPG